MLTLFYRYRPLLVTTIIVLLLAAGAEAGGFAYKPATRESDKLHLTTDLAGYWRLTGDTRHPDATSLDNEIRLMLSLDIGLYKNLDVSGAACSLHLRVSPIGSVSAPDIAAGCQSTGGSIFRRVL
jgi:hypothetical protein